MSTKSTLLIVVVALVVVAASWYISSLLVGRNGSQNQPSQNQAQQQPAEQLKPAPDATANISADLQNVPNDSSTNAESDGLNQDVNNF